MLKKVTQKMVSFLIIFMLLFNLFSPTITFAEGEDENTVEERRNYEIKKEEEWDISENIDGSVIAKWTLEDRTLRISGTGKIKEADSSETKYKYSKYNPIIEKVIIEDGITNIVDYEFYDCHNLKYIKIPNSVTSIGEGAFIACTNLKYIEIPNSVTSIGKWAFDLCTKLESLTIPNGVTSIGEIFSDYVGIKKLEIPDSVIEIESDALSCCTSLKNIKVSENNKYFYDIDGVLYKKNEEILIKYPAEKENTSYIIKDGVSSIGAYAFCGCENLESIIIPDSVTSIETRAFSWCRNLKSITIPNSVTNIETDAFYMCDNLTDITDLTSHYDVENEKEWDISENGDESLIAKWTLEDKTLRISGTGEMKNYQNPWVRDYYKYIEVIEKVEIENGLKSIKKYAFYGCENLESVIIPNSVTRIEEEVFSGCSSMKNITMSDSLTDIGDYAFKYCSSLESITIPSSVTDIKRDSFYYCSNLKNIIVDEDNPQYISLDGVLYTKDFKTILKYPAGKESTSFIINNNVTKIGEYAFERCINLKNITIPNTVTQISSNAFCDCYSLESLEIPNSVTSIGHFAFYGCSSLKTITIPNSVTDIGPGAFSVQNDASSNSFSSGSLENIIIPDSVIRIRGSAFNDVPYIICKANSPAHKYVEDYGVLYFLSNITGIEEYNLGPYEIKNVKLDTTVRDILDGDKIKTDANDLKVCDKEGQELGETEVLKTGMKLVLDDNEEYELSITGDVDGDGDADVDDMLEINRHRLIDQEEEKLKGIYFDAGDVTEDGEVNQYDMLEINRYRLTGKWE